MGRDVWDYQKWGRATDLIHKSDLNGIVGKFGCLSQFQRKKEETATGGRRYENASGKLAAGNAVHAVIARILQSAPAVEAMLDPDQTFSEASIRLAFDQEFERERAGRPVDWYREDGDKWRAQCVAMICGLLDDMRNHVEAPILVEAGFVYELDGIWLTGSTDLVYRAPGCAGVSLCDWKTGKQLPHVIDLDHGWEGGIYGNAVRSAWFVPYANVTRDGEDSNSHRERMEAACQRIAVAWQRVIDAGDPEPGESLENEELLAARMRLDDIVTELGAVRFDAYPARIRYVHLRDYIPYSRGGSKWVSRPEELDFYDVEEPQKVKYAKGETRGPGWYRVTRAESDTPRLRHLLKAVVTWIRFGRFPAAPGEMCSRCRFREPCLVDGFQPIGEELVKLQSAVGELDGFSGFDD